MKQFTPARIAHLREKLAQDDSILSVLDAAIQPVRAHYRIPQTALATWGGFYACPKHSVVLEFDIADPHHYRCPVDGELLTGQPYEGAWWRLLNAANKRACQAAALRYMLLGEAEDLELARNILVDYAKAYPGYEIHGGIPYNKPGKANAQTLCDAQWLKILAMGYDIIRDELPGEERTLIERDLLRCGASFLMAHRTDQIHNHECIVSSAVGVLGILLEDEAYLHFALDTPYGLKYQLEHGMLADGFWFEGTPSYHFYALMQFMEYERFVQPGSYSFFRESRFIEALKYPMRLLQPDNMLPPLNDSGNNNRGFAGASYLYELAYARTDDEDFARLLSLVPEEDRRRDMSAFFDGVDALPDVGLPPLADSHSGMPGGSGLTVMHGPDGRFLLVKHSPYGGEHDHYDRLALHFLGLGETIAPDIGTSQYGAPLHYAYYKSTASHNTVCLNGQNQPPANCAVRSYTRDGEKTVLDAETRWDGSYVPLDSFTIKQWSDEAYRGAVLRRHITWYGDFFVDCYDVTVPEARDIDWTLHVRGERQDVGDTAAHAARWAEEGPGQYLHSAVRHTGEKPVQQTRWCADDGVWLDVYTLRTDNLGMFYALGPDNPSVRDLSYLIERVRGTSARFVNVLCASREGAPMIASVEVGEGGLRIVRPDGRSVDYAFPATI